MKLTRHNGRSGKHGTYNPRHNDRRFDVENSEHIDAQRAKKNVYWDCYRGFTTPELRENPEQPDFSFEEIERMYYYEHYSDHVDAQNARNEKTRHTERNRTVEDLLKNNKTCPEESIYQIGTMEESVPPGTLALIVSEFYEEFERRFGSHIHILDWALHLDEGTPHIHERHVFDCKNRYGELCPQQEKALEELGFELPDPSKPKGKHNNRKQTFDAVCRTLLFDISRKHGVHLEQEPSYGGRAYLEKQDYMPVLDGDFEAFVTNLGKYNEGMLIGEWVKLPTTEEEMQKVFERIGIGKQDEFGQPYEEWFITDYECPIYGVQKMLGEYESLDKLNYLAALIDELSLSDQEKLVAIMESGCDEVSDIDDLINLTFNLDCYDIMPGINDESDLGYYYAHEAGIYSEKDLGPLANYIDYERYGRDIAMDEQGRFTDEGYVRVASERWDRQFNGDLDDIPDEYRITGSGEAAERDSTIAVLVVEPGKEPYVKEIDSGLESLQHEVGGYIEAIYPYEDPIALVCNEEGKLEGLPLNRALRDEDGDIYDVVAGTFMVVGLTDDSFGSLTVEQMQKFSDLFKVPEQFVKLGDKIVAIPMISKEQQKQEATEQKDFEMNADTSGLTVAGHIGTWHTIGQHEVGGHSFYLMEHDTYGDEAACIIIDERGKLVLDDVYNGFDDDTLRLLDLEVKEVPEMPDPALSVKDMKDYGYAWAGVLPAGQEAAEKALEMGCEVYRLYSDNTEGLCVDAKEIADHAAKGGMLGISKESWMAALEKENYLKAAEMSMEDDYGMIDGIINNGPKEDKTLDVKAPETGEKSSIMDRLKSAKAEKQKECCPPKKHKGEIEL